MYIKPKELIGEPLLNFGLSGAQFFAAVLILRFGTITKSVLWRFVKFLFGVACIGVMFKILHWAGADIILPVSMLAIALLYLIHFVKKPKKNHLDILKLLWIVSAFTIKPMILAHWLDRQYSLIPLLFFLLAFADFLLTKKGLRPYFR